MGEGPMAVGIGSLSPFVMAGPVQRLSGSLLPDKAHDGDSTRFEALPGEADMRMTFAGPHSTCSSAGIAPARAFVGCRQGHAAAAAVRAGFRSQTPARHPSSAGEPGYAPLPCRPSVCDRLDPGRCRRQPAEIPTGYFAVIPYRFAVPALTDRPRAIIRPNSPGLSLNCFIVR